MGLGSSIYNLLYIQLYRGLGLGSSIISLDTWSWVVIVRGSNDSNVEFGGFGYNYLGLMN